MPKFSIIIPVYNVAPYLRECFDSVLAQTFTDWEAICIDDGSTDGSGAILDEHAARDPRFRVIHQENAGVSVARNEALNLTRGEWVLFLDADDAFSRTLLEEVVEQISLHDSVDAVAFGVDLVAADGRVIGSMDQPCSGGEFAADELFRRGPLSGFGVAVCNKAFRKSIIDANGIRFAVGMKNHEDTLFAHLFLSFARKVAVIPECRGYKYLMREGSAVHHMRTELPDQPLRQFTELYARWLITHAPGLQETLRIWGAKLIQLGKGENFAPGIRARAIEYLLTSMEFSRQIVPFLILHGSWKARVFAFAYAISPRIVRKKLLMAM